MAEIINLAARVGKRLKYSKRQMEAAEQRAIELVAEKMGRDFPNQSEHACRAGAERFVSQFAGRVVPSPEPERPPLLAPDDPLFDLFGAFKEAQTRYHEELRRRAEQHRMSVKQFAARMTADRRRYRKTTDGCWDGCPDGVLPI